MVNAGINVTWVEHGGQHEIPMPVLDKLGPFIQATLGVE
jgi:predicted esterase